MIEAKYTVLLTKVWSLRYVISIYIVYKEQGLADKLNVVNAGLGPFRRTSIPRMTAVNFQWPRVSAEAAAKAAAEAAAEAAVEAAVEAAGSVVDAEDKYFISFSRR